MREALREGWENFKAGGGAKTVARRFVQTAPYAAVGLGATGFAAGEVLPGLGALLNDATPPSPSQVSQPLSGQEYGPDWAGKGVVVGLVGSAIEAIAHPFVIGRQIREGELDEVPPMPHVGNAILHGLRRGFDHMIQLPSDFIEGGGWQEYQLNLAVFVTGGAILGVPGGVATDVLISNSYSTEFMPVESSLIGFGVGGALGALTALEVTAAEGRRIRRDEAGLTTPRSLLRRGRRAEARQPAHAEEPQPPQDTPT